MKKSVLSLSVLFLVASCSLHPLPYQKIAFINENIKILNKHNNHCKIDVEYSNCSNAFDSYTVYAQTGEYILEPLNNYEWIDTPCNMIKNSIKNALQNYGCNISLQAKNRLTFEIEKFQLVLTGNKPLCEIEVHLKLNSHSKSFTMDLDKKGKMRKVTSFAPCLSNLTQSMETELIKWVNKKIEPTK